MQQCKQSLDSGVCSLGIEVQSEESQGSSLRSLLSSKGVSRRRLMFWCLYFYCVSVCFSLLCFAVNILCFNRFWIDMCL